MSKDKSDRFLEDVAMLAEKAAIAQGVDPKVAKAIGISTAEQVSIHRGGSEIYVAKDRAILKAHRDLYAAYCQQGPVDYSALAVRFGFTEAYTRQVLRRMVAEARASKQASLIPLPEEPKAA